MAYFLTNEDEKKKLPGDSGSSFSTASTGTNTASSEGDAARTASNKNASRGGFVNLNNYVDANKDGVAKQTEGFKTDFGEEYKGLEDSANKYSQGKESELHGGLFAKKNFFDDPNKIKQSDYNKYKNQGSNVDNYKYQDNQLFGETSENLNTKSGLGDLIEGKFGNESYNDGLKKLDTFLMGGSRKGLQDTATGYQGDYDKLASGLEKKYDSNRSKQDQNINAAKKQFGNLFDTSYKSADSGFQDALRGGGYGTDYIKSSKDAQNKLNALNKLSGKSLNTYDVDKRAAENKAYADAETRRAEEQAAKTRQIPGHAGDIINESEGEIKSTYKKAQDTDPITGMIKAGKKSYKKAKNNIGDYLNPNHW